MIVATGGSGLAAHAAKAGTSTIPIVFSSGRDPVEAGLVTSLSRPEGNLTGVSVFSSILTAKRLGLLRELIPQAAVIAVLVNPTSPTVELQLKDVGPRLAPGQKIQIFSANSERDFEPAFSAMAEERIGALVVSADPYFSSKRGHLIALAARHALPAVYEWREFAESAV